MENYNQNRFGDNRFSDYTVVGSSARPVSKTYMASVFLWMFAGLGISALFAFIFASNMSLMMEVFTTPLRWVIMLAPFAFLLVMQFGIQRLSVGMMTLLFILFSVTMGISLSAILLVYTAGSVIGCFTAASAMFGVMALLGYTTDKDLTSFGRIMFMGLIGIVIASLINMFIGSSRMDYIISIIGVAVFTGLTAYDVQMLKRVGAGIEYEGTGAAEAKKLSIMGALRLYLDFINLFLMLIRLFGGRRN